jgi:uncharacterized protein YbjT (DUF2867 family)
MKVLVCGARGFIGARIVASLEATGHDVVRGVSSNAGVDEVQVDYARDIVPAVWLPRLVGIDAVVNAVGVLRDLSKRPMQAVHSDTPKALFDACAKAGVRRVVQISALGIADGDSRYARTKRAADEHLWQLNDSGVLDAVVLRPSVVFGAGGDSSSLFVNMSKLPVLLLPRAVMQTRAQPVAVGELAEVAAELLSAEHLSRTGLIECVGPESLTLAAFIASLREQSGKSAAFTCAIPDWLTQLSAKIGDAVPVTPWGTDALSLLANDNASDSKAFEVLLGRTPTHYRDLFATFG